MTTPPQDVAALARDLAAQAHAGQLDKQGRDYTAHHLAPVAAALRPYGAAAEAAGWLHDVLEDTDLTRDDLLARGVPPVVVEAVESVTKADGEPYEGLVARAAAHPLGRLVKLADNWVNASGLADLARTDPATAGRLERKYADARAVLERSLLDPAG